MIPLHLGCMAWVICFSCNDLLDFRLYIHDIIIPQQSKSSLSYDESPSYQIHTPVDVCYGRPAANKPLISSSSAFYLVDGKLL